MIGLGVRVAAARLTDAQQSVLDSAVDNAEGD